VVARRDGRLSCGDIRAWAAAALRPRKRRNQRGY
jgi:hypothetical protein